MANSSPASASNDDRDNLEVSAIEAALLQSVLDTEQSAPWLATETAEDYDAKVRRSGRCA